MEVKIAKSAGFCPGVKRAVNKVYDLAESLEGPIYTLGPIIHNEEVVKDLEEKGVRAVKIEDLEHLEKNCTVIIRSHGVGRETYNKIEALGLKCEDVTCTFVKKIHKIVEEESKAGNQIVIIGDAMHPEVQGICGWSESPCTVIQTVKEADEYVPEPEKNISIVSQTTFNYNKFKELVEIISKKFYNDSVFIVKILNTICNATEMRQKEAKIIASEVDTMLVVGGRNSSNTQKLYEICKNECGNTYYIQTPVDLDSEMFQSSSCVGITAGASTPNKIIEEVQKHVRVKF